MTPKIRIPDEYREPIFYHREPDQWYIAFAKKHGLKIHTHDFYNPDLFLDNGTWVEVTLSENTAYKKIFRYGHQSDNLLILWLDKDDGFHKKIYENVSFPNVSIKTVESFNFKLKKLSGGPEIINRLKTLKMLKGTIA